MNAFSEFFSLTGWIILHSLWQVFLVWGVFALGARWISANRPQARYRFMMFGLMAMACQPILCLGIGIVVAPVQQLLGPITNAGTSTFEVSQAEFVIEKKTQPNQSEVRSSGNEVLLRNMEHKAIHQWRPLENWLPILGKLWLLGAILLSSRMVVGYLGLSRLRRSAMPPSSLESAILHRLLESSRFHGSVRIARSAQVSVPLVIGFLRPMILMPLAMSTGLKPLELEMILAHELAHLRRYDLWANAFQLTVETLFFYHPCVWHLSRRIRLERELCCDALAADDIEKKAALGRALLAIETNRGNPKILALAACDGDLLHRVRVLSQLPIERPTGWSLLASGMSLGVIVLSALLVIANDDAPQSDQPLPKVATASISENDTNPAAAESKHRVAGRVVDSNGKPIPDAFVLLDVHSSGMGHPTLEFHADSKGQFTIDYSSQVRDDVQFPDTYLWAIADGFNLTCVRPYHSPNGPLECEIRLMPEEQIAVHVWNAAGAGVVEPFFYSVPNGRYQANIATGLSGYVPKSIMSRLATALDGKGNAIMRGIPPQLLNGVQIKIDGFAPQILRAPIPPQPTDSLYFEWARTGSIRGKIRNFGSIPIETKKVQIYSSNKANHSSSSEVSAAIDANGNFHADGLVAGQATVSLYREPSDPLQVKLRADTEIREGQESSCEIELVKGVKTTGTLVTSDTKKPVAKARLSIRRHSVGWLFGPVLSSNELGQFTAYLAPGRWTIQVFDIRQSEAHGNYDYPPTIDFEIAEGAESLTIPPIEFSQYLVEEGQVVNRAGEPIANRQIAWISDRHQLITKSSKTDNEGRFKAKIARHLTTYKGRWVIYPESAQIGSTEFSELPTLITAEVSPWLLVLDRD